MNRSAPPGREPRRAHDTGASPGRVPRARELRTEAAGHALVAAGRALARAGSDLCRGLAAAVRKRRTFSELSRLDDHALADVGIGRTQIPMIAQGLIAPGDVAPRRIVPAAPCPPEYYAEAANDTTTTPAAA